MYKAKGSNDENTAARDRRIKAFNALPPKTQAKVDEKAREAGFDSFLGMVSLFWQEKIFPLFERAYYGSQQGFDKLLDKIRDFVRGRRAQTSGASQLESASLDVVEENKEITSMVEVLKDIESMLNASGLEGAAADRAMEKFLGSEAAVTRDEIQVGQGR